MTQESAVSPYPVFTYKQYKQLLDIFKNGADALGVFAENMEIPIIQAKNKPFTDVQKKHQIKKLLKTCEKFIADLERTELHWEMYETASGFDDLHALLRIKTKILEDLADRYGAERADKTSQYYPLARAVGRAMVKAGLKVSGYEGGVAAKVIDVCIEASRLRVTFNKKELAVMARDAAIYEIEFGCK